jgi:hypothetical protein
MPFDRRADPLLSLDLAVLLQAGVFAAQHREIAVFVTL